MEVLLLIFLYAPGTIEKPQVPECVDILLELSAGILHGRGVHRVLKHCNQALGSSEAASVQHAQKHSGLRAAAAAGLFRHFRNTSVISSIS